MYHFTEDQIDTLAEIANIGAGLAADSLSEMCDEEVLLSIPQVEFLTPESLAERLGNEVSKRIGSVSQSFGGPFSGEALLLFPEVQSLELARLLVDEKIALEDITEMEQETLCELGNIILNATISSLADCLDLEIETGLPSFASRGHQELVPSDSQDLVMFLRMHFRLEQRNVMGFVAFVMGINSVQALMSNVDTYLAGMNHRTG
ncbi:MAG: chemotaxis protein CheC [bacterium]|nr:chemotaxis protein CheC [bacterium]